MNDEAPRAETRISYDEIFKISNLDNRRTKIICTVGSASQDPTVMTRLIDGGMDIMRLDLSTGNHESHEACLSNLVKAQKIRMGKTIATMVDLVGPVITTGPNKEGKTIALASGQDLKIVGDMSVEGDGLCISSSIPLSVRVIVGQTFYIGNGDLALEVKEIGDDFINVKCLNSYDLTPGEVIHLPGRNVDIFGPTEADEKDLKNFVLGGQRIDFVSVPFVRKAEEIQKIREILGIEGAHIKIFAKIENHEGLENFDSILQISDGVIIMRKILGLELPAEKVFLAQKWMTWRANLASKTVIVASNILDTMETSLRIKESECIDVASLIIDGCDCIQLTNETATGMHPEKAVQQLTRICVEAEKTLDYNEIFNEIRLSSPSSYGTAEACAASVVQTCIDMSIGLIIVQTENGNAARLMAKYRPAAKILACAFPSLVTRQLQPIRGVIAHQLGTEHEDKEDITSVMVAEAKKQKLCATGSKVIVLQATNEEQYETSVMRIVTVE